MNGVTPRISNEESTFETIECRLRRVTRTLSASERLPRSRVRQSNNLTSNNCPASSHSAYSLQASSDSVNAHISASRVLMEKGWGLEGKATTVASSRLHLERSPISQRRRGSASCASLHQILLAKQIVSCVERASNKARVIVLSGMENGRHKRKGRSHI